MIKKDYHFNLKNRDILLQENTGIMINDNDIIIMRQESYNT